MPVPPRNHPVGSQGQLRTGDTSLPWPEKAEAPESDGLVQSQSAGGLWSPSLAHGGREKGRTANQLRGGWGLQVRTTGGSLGLPTSPPPAGAATPCMWCPGSLR